LWRGEVSLDPLTVSSPTLLFDSVPCLGSTAGPQQFGGRVATDSDGNAYLSIGEFGYGFATTRQERMEGTYQGRPELLRDPSTLGTIVKVTPDGASEVVSRGHRNPQGLFFDEVTGLLWASEHGPKGGDEVNLIQQGNDYGWPDVTYGGPYGGNPQPDPAWQQGRWFGQNHGEFTEPLFSWLPAIAASQLMVYRGDEFPAWQGDILVAAFRGDIHRLRVVGDRVVLNEAITITERPRDMVMLSDGSLLITTDDDQLMRLRAAG
jgi:aldose sugar dehydrogenase